jgi:hypothetical protein
MSEKVYYIIMYSLCILVFTVSIFVIVLDIADAEEVRTKIIFLNCEVLSVGGVENILICGNTHPSRGPTGITGATGPTGLEGVTGATGP